jgi:hypothetical protein
MQRADQATLPIDGKENSLVATVEWNINEIPGLRISIAEKYLKLVTKFGICAGETLDVGLIGLEIIQMAV